MKCQVIFIFYFIYFIYTHILIGFSSLLFLHTSIIFVQRFIVPGACLVSYMSIHKMVSLFDSLVCSFITPSATASLLLSSLAAFRTTRQGAGPRWPSCMARPSLCWRWTILLSSSWHSARLHTTTVRPYRCHVFSISWFERIKNVQKIGGESCVCNDWTRMLLHHVCFKVFTDCSVMDETRSVHCSFLFALVWIHFTPLGLSKSTMLQNWSHAFYCLVVADVYMD